MTEYGVYVHLPWCARRCHYCSFNVHVDEARPEAAYTRAVIEQWAALCPAFEGRPSTLAFGGGTPSLHPPALLAEIIDAVGATAEISLEANPESMNAEAWLDIGVTRVSVGVQTFDERAVRFLNRHSVEAAHRAISAARAFPSWSVDLIFGLPGQDLAAWDRELDVLLAEDPPHASLYGLTVHPGTPYARAVEAGHHLPVDEDTSGAFYERAAERLIGAGLERYEVSNFARPGHRSRHNTHYWSDRPYAGLGAGAHGYLPDGRRTLSAADPATFIAAPTRWHDEAPTPDQAATDRLLAMIRSSDGVPNAGFDARVVGDLVDAGLVRADDRVRLNGRGWGLADYVTLRLARCAQRSP